MIYLANFDLNVMKYHFILQILTEFWAARNSIWIRHCMSAGPHNLPAQLIRDGGEQIVAIL